MIVFLELKFQITQLSCYDKNLAPSGCTQYYFGPGAGKIMSFNYANLAQLANQVPLSKNIFPSSLNGQTKKLECLSPGKFYLAHLVFVTKAF
jgi:hypothetical protein